MRPVGGLVKFPSKSAERIQAVEAGLDALKSRMDRLEKYAHLIPHKRESEARKKLQPASSGAVKLHLVVGDVEFDVTSGARVIQRVPGVDQ